MQTSAAAVSEGTIAVRTKNEKGAEAMAGFPAYSRFYGLEKLYS